MEKQKNVFEIFSQLNNLKTLTLWSLSMNKPSLLANKHGCPIIFYLTVIAKTNKAEATSL